MPDDSANSDDPDASEERPKPGPLATTVSYANLSPEALEAVRDLESSLSDCHLLAVAPQRHVFRLEMKHGPGDWRPVEEELRALPLIVTHFTSEADAKWAKGRLKNFFHSLPELERWRRPIRIRKVTMPDGDGA